MFPHSAQILSINLLENVGRRFPRIVRWRIAVPVCDIFDVIAFPSMNNYVILGVFSGHIHNILVFQLRVPCGRFFSSRVVIIGLRLFSSVGNSFAAWATLAWSFGKLFRMLPSSIVTVVGVILILQNGPVLTDSGFQFGSFARHFAVDIVICCRSRYM